MRTRFAPSFLVSAAFVLACKPPPVPRTEMERREPTGSWPCSAATFPDARPTTDAGGTVPLRELRSPAPTSTTTSGKPREVAKLGKVKVPSEAPPLAPEPNMVPVELGLRRPETAVFLARVGNDTRPLLERWLTLRADLGDAVVARAAATRALDACVAASCADASCIQLEGERREVAREQLRRSMHEAQRALADGLSQRAASAPLPAPDVLALELARLEDALDASPTSGGPVEAATRRLEELARLLPSPDPLGWHALYQAAAHDPDRERAVRLAEQLVDREAAPPEKAEAFVRLGDREATQRGSARAYEKAFAIVEREKLDGPLALAVACKLAAAVPPRELPETSLRASSRCARERAAQGKPLDRAETTVLAQRVAAALETVADGSSALDEGIPEALVGPLSIAVAAGALGRFDLREAERIFQLTLRYAPGTTDAGVALAGLQRIAEARGDAAQAAQYGSVLDGAFGPRGSRPFVEPIVPAPPPPTPDGEVADLTRRVLALTQKCLTEVDVSSRFRIRFRLDPGKARPASAELEDGVAKELAVCVAARATRFFVGAPPRPVRAQIER